MSAKWEFTRFCLLFFVCVARTVAYLNMGTSLIALGRCHEAAAILRKGSKLDGNGLRDRTAHNNARISMLLQLGSLYVDQGKLQRALAVYRETLHSLPKNYPPQVCHTAAPPLPVTSHHHIGACMACMHRCEQAHGRRSRASVRNQFTILIYPKLSNRVSIIAWATHWHVCISGLKPNVFIRRH